MTVLEGFTGSHERGVIRVKAAIYVAMSLFQNGNRAPITWFDERTC